MKAITSSIKRVIFCIGSGFMLYGCVSQPTSLYYWGDYELQIYNRFKSKTSPEEQIIALEENSQKAGTQGAALPPGYHAHLGMLYAEVGKIEQMHQQMEAEKSLFPESTAFVDLMLHKSKNQVVK